MKFFRIAIACGMAAVLAGCVTAAERKAALDQKMDSLIGHPISDVAIKLGPPIAAFEAGQGQKAFQWYTTDSYRTSGMAIPIGNSVMYNPPQEVKTQCRLTLMAKSPKPSTALSDWIITNWSYNGNGCV